MQQNYPTNVSIGAFVPRDSSHIVDTPEGLEYIKWSSELYSLSWYFSEQTDESHESPQLK
jgi:hypothetical protein